MTQSPNNYKLPTEDEKKYTEKQDDEKKDMEKTTPLTSPPTPTKAASTQENGAQNTSTIEAQIKTLKEQLVNMETKWLNEKQLLLSQVQTLTSSNQRLNMATHKLAETLEKNSKNTTDFALWHGENEEAHSVISEASQIELVRLAVTTQRQHLVQQEQNQKVFLNIMDSYHIASEEKHKHAFEQLTKLLWCQALLWICIIFALVSITFFVTNIWSKVTCNL